MELQASKREVREREKEISSNLERIRRLEADKDKLEEEVHRNLVLAVEATSLCSANGTSFTSDQHQIESNVYLHVVHMKGYFIHQQMHDL